MRFVVTLVIAALASTVLVACGGEDETAAPLTLEQRVLSESEVPGSKADPVETRLTASTLDEFTALTGTYLPAADIEADKLNEAGFVSALQDTRFLPNEPGGAHSRDAFHVRLLIRMLSSPASCKKKETPARPFKYKSSADNALRLHFLDDRIGKFRCFSGAAEVARAYFSFGINVEHSFLHTVGSGFFTDMVQHQDSRHQQRGRVSDALAGDVRRGAMHRFKDRADLTYVCARR